MRALIAQDREAFYDAEIRCAAERALSAVRPARRAGCLRPRQARRRNLRARARPRRAGAGRSARARAGGRAAVSGARPPSLALAGQGAARFRSLGLFARLACRRAEGEGRDQARHRRRSTEFFVASELRPFRFSDYVRSFGFDHYDLEPQLFHYLPILFKKSSGVGAPTGAPVAALAPTQCQE